MVAIAAISLLVARAPGFSLYLLQLPLVILVALITGAVFAVIVFVLMLVVLLIQSQVLRRSQEVEADA